MLPCPATRPSRHQVPAAPEAPGTVGAGRTPQDNHLYPVPGHPGLPRRPPDQRRRKISDPHLRPGRPVPRSSQGGPGFAAFRDAGEGILICTETAAESLNLQFCTALVNYDIPWNPMTLEQRIGRIDRIGQERETIDVINLFYADTAEYDAYRIMGNRMKAIEENVGTLPLPPHATQRRPRRKIG